MLKRLPALALLLVSLGLFNAHAQSNVQTQDDRYYNVEGRLNVWTMQPVLRNVKGGTSPEFLKMRFARHDGFDRVVFDLKGDLASYFVTYSRPPFQSEAGDEIVKVRGQAFVEISLYPVRSADENIEANDRIARQPQNMKMPLLRQVKRVEWFEGEIRYVFGLNRKTPFRVQLFSNPLRLVVDFKH